jgi:hypothetical protein
MVEASKGAHKAQRADCYALVEAVRHYAWELRALSRDSGVGPFGPMLPVTFLCVLLVAGSQIHCLPNLLWKLALVPGFGLLAWATLMCSANLIRSIRDRRMEVRVVRNCLERLMAVAEALADLSFSETFLLNLVLEDARTALEDCSG